MIVFDLQCSIGHRFEGWFGSSPDYEDQRTRRLLACPQCGCDAVAKAPMAPAVPAKGNSSNALTTSPAAPAPAAANAQNIANVPMPPEMRRALAAIAKVQAEALKTSTWVGDKFAEKSRAMHYGEETSAPIHGQASLAEVKALADEGVPVAPVLFPVTPPDEVN
jgi:hypothetical protein